MQLFQHRMRKAGADMADVAPALALAYRKGEGSEIRSRTLWRGEARNYHLLAPRGLDLEPICRAHAGPVEAVSTLGHDAFQAARFGLMKELAPELLAVRTEGEQRMPG